MKSKGAKIIYFKLSVCFNLDDKCLQVQNFYQKFLGS